MAYDKLTVKYSERDEDGNFSEKEDEILVRRLKISRRAQLLDMMRKDHQSLVCQANVGKALISETVCNEEGKTLYKSDDLEQWPVAKFEAYSAALLIHQSPEVEKAAKNS
jgi:hypothetical protein